MIGIKVTVRSRRYWLMRDEMAHYVASVLNRSMRLSFKGWHSSL
jgi:hypothetical protein